MNQFVMLCNMAKFVVVNQNYYLLIHILIIIEDIFDLNDYYLYYLLHYHELMMQHK